MHKITSGLLIAMALQATPFTANADFWRDFRNAVKDALGSSAPTTTGQVDARQSNEQEPVLAATALNREQGHSFADATPMQVGVIQHASLKKKEQDYFKFTASKRATYVIYTSGGTNTTGELYDESFSLKSRDAHSGENGNFRIAHPLEKGQTYYIKVLGREGRYDLHIDGPEGGTTSDDHGFSSWSATTVKPGSVTPGALDVPGDQDYFKFTAGQRATYVIYTTGDTNTTGELYDESFSLKASDATNGEHGNFRIAHHMEKGQTYYVMVRGRKGRYDLHIDGPEGGTTSDDHGFSSWSATTVKPGTITPGVLETPNDQDYFKFTADQRATYVIYTTGGTNTSGELYDESFSLKARDANSGEYRNFRIAHPLEKGQTYYVMVRGRVGRYDLHIDDPDIPGVTKLLNIPFFSQNNPAWKKDKVGTCPNEIGGITGVGCAVTSLAMLLASKGVDVTPKSLNIWLSENDGYINGCQVSWKKATELNDPERISWLTSSETLNENTADLKKWIDDGRLIIAKSNRFDSHWVVLRGYKNAGTRLTDYLYWDPWDNDPTDHYIGDGMVHVGAKLTVYR